MLFSIRLGNNLDYGEARHLKGPHDDIGGAVKSKVFSDVKATKVVIQNAYPFAEYTNEVCNVNVLYLDKNDIQYPNTDDSVYVYGTLKAHQVKRINEQSIEFFFNFQYKKNSEMLRKISYGQLVSGVTNFSPNDTDANEIDNVEPEED